MAVALGDIAQFIDSHGRNGHRLGRGFAPEARSGHSVDAESLLKSALHDIQQALFANADFLAQAQKFRERNQADPALTGFENYEDHKILSQMDQLALVSGIHFDWAQDLDVGIKFLGNLRGHAGALNNQVETLYQELCRHKANLDWVVMTTRSWSEELGREYDRRHPDVPGLPFEPIDMGPTNSARLPPVL